jgi:hypothetical protein
MDIPIDPLFKMDRKACLFCPSTVPGLHWSFCLLNRVWSQLDPKSLVHITGV